MDNVNQHCKDILSGCVSWRITLITTHQLLSHLWKAYGTIKPDDLHDDLVTLTTLQRNDHTKEQTRDYNVGPPPYQY
jgi:hypothetical protein